MLIARAPASLLGERGWIVLGFAGNSVGTRNVGFDYGFRVLRYPGFEPKGSPSFSIKPGPKHPLSISSASQLSQ